MSDKYQNFIDQKRKALEELNKKLLSNVDINVESGKADFHENYVSLKDNEKVYINISLKNYLEKYHKSELQFAFLYVNKKEKIIFEEREINVPKNILYPLNFTFIGDYPPNTPQSKIEALKKAKEQEIKIKKELVKLATLGNEFKVMNFINDVYVPFKTKVDSYIFKNKIGYFVEIFYEKKFNYVGHSQGSMIIIEHDDYEDEFLQIKQIIDKQNAAKKNSKAIQEQTTKENIKLRFTAQLLNADLNGATDIDKNKIQQEYRETISNLCNISIDKVKPIQTIRIDKSQIAMINTRKI